MNVVETLTSNFTDISCEFQTFGSSQSKNVKWCRITGAKFQSKPDNMNTLLQSSRPMINLPAHPPTQALPVSHQALKNLLPSMLYLLGLALPCFPSYLNPSMTARDTVTSAFKARRIEAAAGQPICWPVEPGGRACCVASCFRVARGTSGSLTCNSGRLSFDLVLIHDQSGRIPIQFNEWPCSYFR